MAKYTLLNFSSDQEFLDHAILDFKRLQESAIAERGKFCVALSGGKTPKILYKALAQIEIDWSKTHFYFGDERYVPETDPLSNFGMVQKNLLAYIKIPKTNIHPVQTQQIDPHEAARLYELEMQNMQFDLIYLGIGADGHTASLFPGLLFPHNQKVAAIYVRKLNAYRISFLPDLINEGRQIRFLVSGAEKKPILDYILQTPEPSYRYPCQLIRSCEILAYGL